MAAFPSHSKTITSLPGNKNHKPLKCPGYMHKVNLVYFHWQSVAVIMCYCVWLWCLFWATVLLHFSDWCVVAPDRNWLLSSTLCLYHQRHSHAHSRLFVTSTCLYWRSGGWFEECFHNFHSGVPDICLWCAMTHIGPHARTFSYSFLKGITSRIFLKNNV